MKEDSISISMSEVKEILQELYNSLFDYTDGVGNDLKYELVGIINRYKTILEKKEKENV